MTLTKKQAWADVGGLSKPSKMPCPSFGFSASKCLTGSKLRKVPGSTCEKCYAHDGLYRMDNTKTAHARRFKAMQKQAIWERGMIKLISGLPYFRWHDSGDIQSVDHLASICRIIRKTPETAHWMPTRERAIVAQYKREHGPLPDNLVCRISAAMVDGAPAKSAEHTSTVHKDGPAIGHECPAYKQGGACDGDLIECRACWDKSIPNISYPLHV